MGVLTTLLYKQTIYKTVCKNKIVRIKVGLTEAVVQGCSVKKMFLEILQKACNFIKKETLAQVFFVIFEKFLRTPVVAASG